MDNYIRYLEDLLDNAEEEEYEIKGGHAKPIQYEPVIEDYHVTYYPKRVAWYTGVYDVAVGGLSDSSLQYFASGSSDPQLDPQLLYEYNSTSREWQLLPTSSQTGTYLAADTNGVLFAVNPTNPNIGVFYNTDPTGVGIW